MLCTSMSETLEHFMPDAVKLQPALYLIATPIGNLKDITIRALETLKSLDVLYCEDTRVTQKLLKHYGIHVHTKVYNDHSNEKVREHIIDDISKGRTVGLVSDAGTPLISDPGFKLVRECREQGIKVVPLPGASSLMAALMIAGLPTDKFLFCGFLDSNKGKRNNQLKVLSNVLNTLVFFERASRLLSVLEAMKEIFGERQCVVARELTKQFEESLSYKTFSDAITAIENDEVTTKGEIVILVQGAGVMSSSEDIDQLLKRALESMSLKEAVANVSSITNQSKKVVYEQALKIKDGQK